MMLDNEPYIIYSFSYDIAFSTIMLIIFLSLTIYNSESPRYILEQTQIPTEFLRLNLLIKT